MVKPKQQKQLYKKWERRIDSEKKAHGKFREIADKALKVYEADTSVLGKKNTVVFPILRNAIEVQIGLITSKQPQAKISQRFEEGPINNGLCSKLEKATNYFVETGSMQTESTEAFEDHLSSGLGVMKVQYDHDEEQVTYENIQIDPITGQEMFGPDGMPIVLSIEERTEIVNERVWGERYEWRNFHWEPCKRWSECEWIAFKSNLTREQFIQQYNVSPNKYVTPEEDQYQADIEVYEIWDKQKKVRLYWTDSHGELLKDTETGEVIEENPYKTDYFYPCAEPMMFGLLSENYEPRPEYHFWQRLHEMVQQLSRDEAQLSKGLVDIEFFADIAFPEVSQLENAEHGKKIAVNMSAFMVNGKQVSINDLIMAKDHSGRMMVLDKLTEKRNELLDKIYQITGIADIMQGVSDPRETARAQGYKNAWGNARLARKRFCYENHIRGTLEIMINTMCKLMQPKSLSLAAGEEFSDDEIEVLRNSDEYRIDVETLSTLSVDKDRDQTNAIEQTNAISGLFDQTTTMPDPLRQSLLKNMIKTFPDGREFEETINQLPQYTDTVNQLQQQLQELQQQLAESEEQQQAMAQELNDYNQAKQTKDMAEAQKKSAETRKIEVETAQAANEMVVNPLAMTDEQVAYNHPPVIYNP